MKETTSPLSNQAPASEVIFHDQAAVPQHRRSATTMGTARIIARQVLTNWANGCIAIIYNQEGLPEESFILKPA